MKKAGIRRIYVVRVFSVAGLMEERLVRSGHPKTAEAFVFRERIEAKIATADDVARLMEEGCGVEDADAPAASEIDNGDFKPTLPDLRAFEFPNGGKLELAEQP